MLRGIHAKMEEYVSQAGVEVDQETQKAIDHLQWYD